MFKFCSLFSGSSGNCLLLQTSNSNFLIDIGVSCKKVVESLNDLNIDPSSIDGIIITHEHQDHIKGLNVFSKKYNTSIYVEEKVKHSLENIIDTSKNNIKTFKLNENFSIRDLNIKNFEIPHDAINPCGFSFFHDNLKFSIATDIGHMTRKILDNLEESNLILLESNYDENILMANSYPYSLKRRIKSPNGHLSNIDAAKTIAYLSENKLNGAILGHLSANSNFDDLAYETTQNQLKLKNINKSFSLHIAPRDKKTKIFDIKDYD